MSREILNEGGWANGRVYRERDGAGDRVVKTYRGKSWVIRLLGRYLLARESRAYQRLAGIAGIPALLPTPDPLSLVIEHVEAERISNERLARDGEVIARDFQRLVADMHARGVYHLDLRNQGNVLVDAEGRCYLIDFASSLVLPPGSLRRILLTAPAKAFDRYGAGKWLGRARELSSPRR
ncbi:MAG: lipopolysaccharide kinase InaA family protein [Pseudomonadota bacterium]